jgi:phage-related minor tail protein
MIKSVLLEVGVINKVRSKINDINRATSFDKVGSAINKVRFKINDINRATSFDKVGSAISRLGKKVKSKVK